MKNKHAFFTVPAFLFLLLLPCMASGQVGPLNRTSRSGPKETAGFDPKILALIDPAVEEALAAGKMPGCVVCIGRSGRIAFLKAYGDKQIAGISGSAVPMRTDTLFDLASLTKPIATATSVMLLIEQGKLELDAPAARYLKEFDTPEKRNITIRQLLIHTAGFIADNALKDYEDGPEKAAERLLALDPQTKPGEAFRYSDVSYQMLGLLIERVSGKSVAAFSRAHIFQPLGMKETGYTPNASLARRAAPTQDRELGKVHDPRAFRTGGVAGHAGLFSTAEDLALYASMLLDEGKNERQPALSPSESKMSGGRERTWRRSIKPETVRLMRTPNSVPGGYRGLGWDMWTGYSGNRGKTMSPQAFGHGGFTGTSIWIDPARDLFVIFLSNRVHPDGKGSVNPLAGRIGSIAVDALLHERPADAARTIDSVRKEMAGFGKSMQKTETVHPGIDVLAADRFKLLRGKRVGLITNHTGLTRSGRPITGLLHESPDVELVALFSPEHGFAGTLDQANIGDSRDPVTGLPVYSLYGKVRRPTPQMLENIDMLLFDIQDIGTRFYTYISTMLDGMEAAAMKGIPFVVLDRPNPIGGDRVEGPLLEPGRETTVGCHRLPLRHGMTVGELALLFNIERRLGLELHVVPCTGWNRAADYEATGLPWVHPSPNMRSLTAAYLYPGVGLIEFTNVSVGRGTETPFEHFGAPWIDGGKLAVALESAAQKAELSGVRFEACRFTPETSKFEKQECGGVRFLLENREIFQPVKLGMVIAATLRRLYPEEWETARLDTLLIRARSRQMILEGKSPAEIEADWKAELDSFLDRRASFLLYE